jgi:putative ABC transport system ATP-binding protein
MNANAILVQARDVRHAYGEGDLRKEVLHGISCEVYSREIMIITGPSGSGKTTFLTLIGALRRLQTGSVTLLGQELRGAKPQALVEARRAIGFIFQEHNLLPAFTACENVQLALAVEPGLSSLQCRTRAMDLLSAVGMSEHVYKRPAQLSGGQRQRVAIARALVRRPRVILADEPTASLDRVTGREIVDLLQGLAREENCALVLITHDLRILTIGDRLLHLEDGILTIDHSAKESAERDSR